MRLNITPKLTVAVHASALTPLNRSMSVAWKGRMLVMLAVAHLSIEQSRQSWKSSQQYECNGFPPTFSHQDFCPAINRNLRNA